MWTAVYMVEGLDEAKEIKEKLEKEGFLIRIKFFAKEGDEDLYEILAPEFEASEVQSALIDLGY
jgi:hypothetical protein